MDCRAQEADRLGVFAHVEIRSPGKERWKSLIMSVMVLKGHPGMHWKEGRYPPPPPPESPGSGVWMVQTEQGGPRSPHMAQSAEGNHVPQA